MLGIVVGGVVAERFHCSEAYLRALNSSLPAVPGIGAEFRVPNVIPFEIEKARGPLQAQGEPKYPIAAAIEASPSSISIAMVHFWRFPFSIARPGLRRRGTSTILGGSASAPGNPAGAVEGGLQKARSIFRKPTPTPTPMPIKPKLASEQFLAAGPRNPAGIVSIDLANG